MTREKTTMEKRLLLFLVLSFGMMFIYMQFLAPPSPKPDLPGGNVEQLIAAIKEKLLPLPGETKVLTGHGPTTTITTEKQFNQYLA